MSDEQIRCFVGIAAADMGLQDVLMQQVDTYRCQPAFAKIRWTPATFMHLTLCFLGHQPLTVLSALASELGRRLSPLPTFALPLVSCCGFPDAKSRIVAAMPVLTPALAQLQAQVVDAVSAAGIAPESRAYVPHITLGRVMHGECLPPLLDALNVCGEVKAVSLYRSQLQARGSHYDVIHVWPLVAQAAVS